MAHAIPPPEFIMKPDAGQNCCGRFGRNANVQFSTRKNKFVEKNYTVSCCVFGTRGQERKNALTCEQLDRMLTFRFKVSLKDALNALQIEIDPIEGIDTGQFAEIWNWAEENEPIPVKSFIAFGDYFG